MDPAIDGEHTASVHAFRSVPLDVYADVRSTRDFTAHGFRTGRRRFEDMVARYDAETSIRHTIGISSRTRALGAGQDAVVVTRHGEEFLDTDSSSCGISPPESVKSRDLLPGPAADD